MQMILKVHCASSGGECHCHHCHLDNSACGDTDGQHWLRGTRGIWIQLVTSVGRKHCQPSSMHVYRRSMSELHQSVSRALTCCDSHMYHYKCKECSDQIFFCSRTVLKVYTCTVSWRCHPKSWVIRWSVPEFIVTVKSISFHFWL